MLARPHGSTRLHQARDNSYLNSLIFPSIANEDIVTEPPWDLVVAGPARRAIDRLPEQIVVAVLDSLVGPLLQNPHRVGKPSRGDLTGLHSARVGAYRIVYQIDEANRTVRVIYIDHPADIYRPR